jgi:hypothetical protein
MRNYSMRFGVLALEKLRELGYKVVPINPGTHGADVVCASALAGAYDAAHSSQVHRRNLLRDTVEAKYRQLEDDHGPDLAAEYAAEARELADLEAELGR